MQLNSNISTKYRIAVNGSGWLTEDGYSKYFQRLKMYDDGKIAQYEIYGPDQCAEHVAEYYAKADEYYESRQNDVLTIEEVITITTPVKKYERPYVPTDREKEQLRGHSPMERGLLLHLMALRARGNKLAGLCIEDIKGLGRHVEYTFPQRSKGQAVYFSEATILYDGQPIEPVKP
jgi:hypothetical protein